MSSNIHNSQGNATPLQTKAVELTLQTSDGKNRRMRTVKKAIDIRYCSHVGIDGTAAILFMLLLSAGHGYLVYEYSRSGFDRYQIYVFMALGTAAFLAAIHCIVKWKNIALDYSQRALEKKKKGPHRGLKALYEKTYINGPYFLWKLYATEILESGNQLRNLFELYLCSLPLEVSSTFCFVLAADGLHRSYCMLQKNTPKRRDMQINVDIGMDFGSMVFPLCFLNLVLKVPISIDNMLWIVLLPSGFLLMKARSMFREFIRLHSTKQLRLRVGANDQPMRTALEQQKSIPAKIRFVLVLYFAGYSLFVLVLGLAHIILFFGWYKSCDQALWGKYCAVKVPYCQKMFEPSCDCAVLDVPKHNWTVLPASIKEMKSLSKMAIKRGPLKDIAPMQALHDLIYLDLSFNDLSEVNPWLGNLFLIELNLQNNKLTDLPHSVWGNPELYVIQVNNNNISYIPKSIEQAKKLTHLFMSNNSVSVWPREIANLNIYDIALDGNLLTDIPREIGDIASLSCLSLQNNKIRALPKEMASLSNMRWVDLRNNSIVSLDNVDTLRVEHLYLYGNPICVNNLWNERVREFVKQADSVGAGCTKQCSPYCLNIFKDLRQCLLECMSEDCEYSWGQCRE